MIYVVIILATALAYLFVKVRKLENKLNQKPLLEVIEGKNGGIILVYKGKEIYNAKPKE